MLKTPSVPIWLAAAVAIVAGAGGYAVHSRVTATAAALATTARDAARTQRIEQFRLLKAPIDVVMLGDSLTAHGEWTELLGRPTANRGAAGDTVAGVASRLDGVPEGATVFLMIGVNDLAAGRPAADVARATRSLVRDLGPRKVVVQSVLVTADPALNRRIAELNRMNRDACETGACRYLDLNDLMASDGALRRDLDLDGVHLRAPAYLLWADRVRPLLD